MTTELLFHVLLALAVVVVAGRTLGVLVARVGHILRSTRDGLATISHLAGIEDARARHERSHAK